MCKRPTRERLGNLIRAKSRSNLLVKTKPHQKSSRNLQFYNLTMAAGLRYGNQLIVNNDALKRRSSCVLNNHSDLKSGPDASSLDDIYLYKTGIRGRKKYVLYIIIVLMFLVALANLLTTFALMGVLRLGYGMESLEFIPKGLLVRFLQSTSIDVVYPTNGVVGGFKGEDLDIIGNNQPIILQNKHSKPTSVIITPEETTISNVDIFKVVDPKSGQLIFSTEYVKFGLPKVVKKLNVHQITTNKISSPVNRPLSLDSNTLMRMRGNEGLHLISSELVLTAGEDVYFKSRNGSIILDGKYGLVLNVDKLPRVTDSEHEFQEPYQYKICICMPSGKLFRIPLRQADYNCANAVTSGRINPCI